MKNETNEKIYATKPTDEKDLIRLAEDWASRTGLRSSWAERCQNLAKAVLEQYRDEGFVNELTGRQFTNAVFS